MRIARGIKVQSKSYNEKFRFLFYSTKYANILQPCKHIFSLVDTIAQQIIFLRRNMVFYCYLAITAHLLLIVNYS